MYQRADKPIVPASQLCILIVMKEHKLIQTINANARYN